METKDVILELRTRSGLSQEALAEKLFVTRQAVSRWETGETIPNAEALKLLSKLFDVSINTLLGSPRTLICQCCGMPLESKGLAAQADAKAEEMVRAIWAASADGTAPVVLDTSPCSFRLKKHLKDAGLQVLDLVEFIHDHLLDRLTFTKQTEPVVLHLTCSTRRMGLDAKMKAVAAACATEVVVPEDVGCCGFAGDKGFTTPELNAHALRHLSKDIPAGAKAGYSNSRTCEIGLSDHSGLPYRSIVYLVDACSTPKAPATASTRASEPAF